MENKGLASGYLSEGWLQWRYQINTNILRTASYSGFIMIMFIYDFSGCISNWQTALHHTY